MPWALKLSRVDPASRIGSSDINHELHAIVVKRIPPLRPTATNVTVFALSERQPVPVFLTSINVGVNPFGLTFAP